MNIGFDEEKHRVVHKFPDDGILLSLYNSH